MGTPSEFLGQVFQGVDDGFVTLNCLRERLSSTRLSVTDLSGVDAFVDQHKETLYYNVGVTRECLKDGVRGSKADVSAVCCLWADVDMPKEEQKKQKKYPTRDAIDKALADMPLPYTALVHTGGGVHVYWFLKEPYAIGSVTDAEKFENTLNKPWTTLLKVKLAKYGDFELDSVHDVTRMLRIPGSMHKNGNQCVVEDADYDRRYNPDDFAPFIEAIDVARLTPNYVPAFTGPVNGMLNPARLDALLHNCKKFADIWSGKRPFESASEGDAAVAYHGIMAGWSDDEIANLMYAWRLKHHPGKESMEKITRKEAGYGSYIGRVLAFVRRNRESEVALARLGGGGILEDGGVPVDDTATGPVTVAADGTVPMPRAQVLSIISDSLKVPVARWIQVGLEDPIFTLILADGRQVKIGGEAAVVDSPKAFERRIYSELHVKIPPLTKAQYENLLRGLCRIVEVTEAPEIQLAEVARNGISQYLEANRPLAESERGMAMRQNRSFTEGSKVYFSAPDVIRWLNMHGGSAKWTNREFINACRKLGYTRDTVHYEFEWKRSTKSYWQAPADDYGDVADARKQ
jgi:hypothetical protein